MALTQVQDGMLGYDGGSFANRNRIINGDMRIDQRNAGAAVTINSADSTYTVDRFITKGESADGVFTVDQVTDAPAGFTNSAKITVTTADASIGASQLYIFGQVLEGFNVADLGFGTANAKTVTLSFWVRSSLTGTFGGSLKNDSTYSYPFTYTISAADTWEYKTVTITGQTAGTWSTDNSAGMRLLWSLGVGSTYTTTGNAWASGNYFKATGATDVIGTNGATLYITGVQLEAGSVATPFEHRQYGQELALCQRYFQYSKYYFEYAMGTTGSLGGPVVPFNTIMRTTPTFTQLSTSGANTTIGGPSVSSSSGTGAYSYLVTYTSSSSGYGYRSISYSLSAEL
jgi:hypothetical protein